MKISNIICGGLLLFCNVVAAQHVKVSSGTNMTMSSSINLVLKDISLTNEATLDGDAANIVVNNGGSVTLQTNSDLSLSTLEISGTGGQVYLEGGFDIDDLTVPSNHTSYLSDTSSLTVNTSITNTGDLVLESGASLILKSDVSSISDITVSRITTFNSSTGKYSMVGAMLKSNGFSVLGTNAQSWIWEYDETEAYGSDGSARFKAPSESTMTMGKGYFSAFTGDSNGEITFTGTPQWKNLTYAVTRTSNMGDANDVKGFNLVSNPFTSAIEFDRFMSTNSSVLEEESIWLWDDIASNAGGGTNDDYVTINDLGNTDSRGGRETDWDATMNSGQAFFIKASTSDNITFNQAMKTHDGNDDASYFRTESLEIEKYWIGIEAVDGSFIGTNTLVGFHPEATTGADKKFDATKYGEAFSLFTIIDESRYAIQGLPDNWTANVDSDQMIKIGYVAEEEGEFQISIQRIEYPSGTTLYLNDHELMTSIELTEKSYAFSSEAGVFYNRFSLTTSAIDFTVTETPLIEKDIQVYGTQGMINIKSGLEGELAIISIDGKNQYLEALNKGEVSIPVIQSGVYVVRLETMYGITSYKVLVD